MCFRINCIKQELISIQVLGPLLFLISINDIVDDVECFINLFADDTSVQQSIIDIPSFDKVNRDFQ